MAQSSAVMLLLEQKKASGIYAMRSRMAEFMRDSSRSNPAVLGATLL